MTGRKTPRRGGRHRTPRLHGGANLENLIGLLEAAKEELDGATAANRRSNAAPDYVSDASLAVVKASYERILAQFNSEQARSKKADLSAAATALAEKAVDTYPLKPTIINPDSRFVVATYWWGSGKINANLGRPCPDIIMTQIKNDIEEELLVTDKIYAAFVENEWQPALAKVEDENGTWLNPSAADMDAWLKAKATRVAYLNKHFAREDTKKKIRDEIVPAYNARPPSTNPDPRRRGDGGLSKQPTSLDAMIEGWEATCRAMNCNFLSQQYPELSENWPKNYQSAINAKPLFIKKALQACGGRGVLYIDGDMFLRQYPKIFDMQNVDFMAHGWNCDPRSNIAFKEWQCFDPYIFETSGGTMFFADTPAAHRLLDGWSGESHKPDNYGKADDRILSMVFTMQNLVLGVNLIQLPIEYLWLTDKYEPFEFNGAADVKDAIIEHPACLTAEEAAAEQGASNDRYPIGYNDEVTNRLQCDRPGGYFYEFIAFNTPEAVDAFGPYLKWMRETVNTETGRPMFYVIPFDKTFGPYEKVAIKNYEIAHEFAATRAMQPLPTEPVVLPFSTSIAEILYYLTHDIDVNIGASPGIPEPGIEVIATNRGARVRSNYLADIKIDVTQPIFFSHRSRTLRLLLRMCESLGDINRHLFESYIFVSRIRWSLIQQGPSSKKVNPFEMVIAPVLAPIPLNERQQAAKERQELEASMVAEAERRPNVLGVIPKKVHQIWMGGAAIPPWRQYLFDLNREVATRNGYVYRLWTNDDRNRENFPSTIAYQDVAIQVGTMTGQSRWAQVADLARLEIVYTHGGIYIDSLFETGDEFYAAITQASQNNYKFVGCNEDPCGLECKGADDMPYLTNSFFAAVQWSKILERLINDDRLGAIKYSSQYINRTTGPYYLRTGILDAATDSVFLLETDEMFPFNVNATDYREVHPNTCLSPTEVPDSINAKPGVWLKKNCLAPTRAAIAATGQKPPLAIYHSGLGGTWSF
jgi:hypothetical protein